MKTREMTNERLISKYRYYCELEIYNDISHRGAEKIENELEKRGIDPGKLYSDVHDFFLKRKFDLEDETAEVLDDEPKQEDHGVFELDYSLQQLAEEELAILRKRGIKWIKVIGDSMINEGILDQDTVLIDTQDDNFINQIVVVRIWGDKLMIKKYIQDNGKAILRSANARHKDVEVTEDMDLEVLGVVKGKLQLL